MSAEERAKAIALLAFDSDAVTSMIARAIRQAEASARNEALEAALSVAEEICATEKAMPGARYESEAYAGMTQVRDAIRNLKTKD